MKPITLTMTAGARPRINPLHLLTWAPSVIESGGKSHLGATIILTDGVARQVLENAEQIDWLFERATAEHLEILAVPARRSEPPMVEDPNRAG